MRGGMKTVKENKVSRLDETYTMGEAGVGKHTVGTHGTEKKEYKTRETRIGRLVFPVRRGRGKVMMKKKMRKNKRSWSSKDKRAGSLFSERERGCPTFLSSKREGTNERCKFFNN